MTRDPNHPVMATRVISRKGKDLLLLKDGRWGEIKSETKDDVVVEVDSLKWVGGPGPHRAYNIKWVKSGKKETYTIPKKYIEDKRTDIEERRKKSRG